MTSAKLLSAIEPVIRYQRGRFRGSEQAKPGALRYELGIQQRQDALHRLAGLWAMGEAGASLGFAAARLYDEVDPLEKQKTELLAAKNIRGGKAEMKYFREINQAAIELVREERLPAEKRSAKYEACKADPLVQFVLKDSVANVLCPAAKLWNTGTGANAMREALSLMGGYGITEDCPGFLAYKWMDAQLEATYEGPEAVQRRNLSVTMTSEVFLAQYQQWILDMRAIASRRPGTGACTLATAMQLWLWSYQHLRVCHRRRWRRTLPERAPGRDLPARPMRCAGCSPPASSSSTSSNSKKKVRRIRSSPKAWPARSSSSPTSATSRRPGRREKSAASAPSWFSATTAIPHGTKRVITDVITATKLPTRGLVPGIIGGGH